MTQGLNKMTDEELAMHEVNAAIVKITLQKAYECINALLAAVDTSKLPRPLLVECRRLLPSKFSASFEAPKAAL